MLPNNAGASPKARYARRAAATLAESDERCPFILFDASPRSLTRIRNATRRWTTRAPVKPARVSVSSAWALELNVRTGCAYVLLFFACPLYAAHQCFIQEGNSVQEIREKIKTFLAQNGMIKGHSGTANLRVVDPSTSSRDAIANGNTNSPSGSSHLLHPQGLSMPGANGLSTPLSATSTLTPDDRSSSPSTPPNSRAHHDSLEGDRPFPPSNGGRLQQGQYDQPLDASGMRQGEILDLSGGRPIAVRTQSARTARQTGYGHDFGAGTSGLGLMSMDPLNTNGNGIPNGGNHTRRSSSAHLRCRRTADLLGYAHRISGILPFSRAHSMTAIGQPSLNTMTRSHAAPTSFSVPLFTGRSAYTLHGASRPNAYGQTPSNETATANFISNTMHVASPTFGSTSSITSSPPMASRNTPLTPYTPQPSLPALPLNDIKPDDDMDLSSTMSAFSSTPFSVPTPASDVPLLSPCLDAGSFGSGVDMDAYRMSRQNPSDSGYEHGSTSNNDTGLTTPTCVRVKLEPDVDGFTFVRNHAAHDPNPYVHHSYGNVDVLRPRSSTIPGCAAPSSNNFTAYDSCVTNNELPSTSPSHPMATYIHNDNFLNNYARNSFPTDNRALHCLHPSTSNGTHGLSMLAPHATTVNSPYTHTPQLAPDSPKPTRAADAMIGVYPSNSAQSAGPTYIGAGPHIADEFSLNSGPIRHGGAGHGGIESGHGYGHSNGYGHNPTAPSSCKSQGLYSSSM